MKYLAAIRKTKGFTQGELAKAVGVSRYSIMDYEKCRISPTLEVTEKIAHVLGLSLTDLLNPPPPSAVTEERGEPRAEHTTV